jgi:hypothetical protein
MHYANSSLIVGFHSLILHYTFSYASIHDKVDRDWEKYFLYRSLLLEVLVLHMVGLEYMQLLMESVYLINNNKTV